MSAHLLLIPVLVPYLNGIRGTRHDGKKINQRKQYQSLQRFFIFVEVVL